MPGPTNQETVQAWLWEIPSIQIAIRVELSLRSSVIGQNFRMSGVVTGGPFVPQRD